jgi:hypothetical protein
VTPVLPKLLTANLPVVDPHGNSTTSLAYGAVSFAEQNGEIPKEARVEIAMVDQDRPVLSSFVESLGALEKELPDLEQWVVLDLPPPLIELGRT